MVRGRTTAPAGLILGHEITGEVIEKGSDVEMLEVGDIVTVPFNIACGRCRNCREGKTGICLTVNPARPGAAYGYVDMGGWVGGQAEYVLVPYADFNLIKFPNKEKALAKIKDLTLLSDIFSHWVSWGDSGRRDYRINRVCGWGRTCRFSMRGIVPPTGRCCRYRWGHDSGAFGSGQKLRLLNDRSSERSIAATDQIAQITGEPLVDSAIDCVGFEASRAWERRQRGTARHGPEFDHGNHARGRIAGNPWIVCDR